MLTLMNEAQETVKTTVLGTWSAAATNFVEATSWASLDELSEVSTSLRHKQPTENNY